MTFETSLGYVRLCSKNYNKPACFFLSLPPFPLRRQFIVPTNAVSPICTLSFSCLLSPSLPAPRMGDCDSPPLELPLDLQDLLSSLDFLGSGWYSSCSLS